VGDPLTDFDKLIVLRHRVIGSHLWATPSLIFSNDHPAPQNDLRARLAILKSRLSAPIVSNFRDRIFGRAGQTGKLAVCGAPLSGRESLMKGRPGDPGDSRFDGQRFPPGERPGRHAATVHPPTRRDCDLSRPDDQHPPFPGRPDDFDQMMGRGAASCTHNRYLPTK
jgi:hypothetical protein